MNNWMCDICNHENSYHRTKCEICGEEGNVKEILRIKKQVESQEKRALDKAYDSIIQNTELHKRITKQIHVASFCHIYLELIRMLSKIIICILFFCLFWIIKADRAPQNILLILKERGYYFYSYMYNFAGITLNTVNNFKSFKEPMLMLLDVRNTENGGRQFLWLIVDGFKRLAETILINTSGLLSFL